MENTYDHPEYVQDSRLCMFVGDKPSVYYTPKWLLDSGICVCDTCGRQCSTDTRWCSKCDEEVMILVKK